jgi:hypothetical protein
MALIEAPTLPLRDVQLRGGMLGLVRFLATARMLAAMALMVTYFQTWHEVHETKLVEPPAVVCVGPDCKPPVDGSNNTAATDQAAPERVETGKVTRDSGFQHFDHKITAPLLAAVIFALAYLLFSKPSLSTGMLSAAGTALLSFLIFRATFDMRHGFDRIEPMLPQALFGLAFVALALTAAADMMFHPILYQWARRDQERPS